MARLKFFPKVVFFDLDGVILESAAIKTQSFIQLFSAWPVNHARVKKYLGENAGVSRFVKFRYIFKTELGRALSAAEERDLGRRFSRLALKKVLACPTVPGLSSLLRFLRPRARLFVVSATPQKEARQVLKKRGLAGHFSAILGSPRTKDKLIREVLSQRRYKPGEALFVGDAPADFRAAQKTKVGFVARVPSGTRNPFPRSVRRAADLRVLEKILKKSFRTDDGD